jgi:hypothetical protein
MTKYEKIAEWIYDECDNPIDEIAWLLKKLYSKTARFSNLDFNEAFGDVLEMLNQDEKEVA